MERVCFEDVRLTSGVDYFLYIGEIKAFGLNEFVRQGLERRFGRPFKPIGICPDILADYQVENCIVINPWAKRPRVTLDGGEAARVSAGPFVAHISASRYVRSLCRLLAERQDRVFVWMFESRPEFTLFDDIEGLTLLGPGADLVYRINDKTWQYETLSQVAPVVDFAIAQGRNEMLACCADMLAAGGHGVFVSCAYSAGGVASKVVTELDQADAKFTDPGGRYLLSRYHPHSWDPTVLGVVANEREVFIGGVADMNIVGGNKFRGSTYPSQLPADVRHRLREYTRAVGRKLGELGFRGIFGCDYIVDDAGDIFFIEVNPRKQGTTMEYCCTMEHVLPPGAPNMPELEIWAVLDGAFPPNMVEPDYDAAESGIVHWGTFNHKIDRACVHTSNRLPQRLPERELFRRLIAQRKSGHVILEHVGADVDVLPGTFMGRVAAVGDTREHMLAALARGRKKLENCILDE